MLSRDLSPITNEMWQLQHKTIPPYFEFVQLKPINSLKQIHYLVEHGDVIPTQNKYFHPILVEYGDDQYTIRILDKGNTVTYTPLNSLSFKSASSFSNKYTKSIKNEV